MNFTPGPWKVIPEKLQADGTHIAGRCSKVVRDDATGLEVARVYRAGDARLIAAAPEMYEALEAFVEQATKVAGFPASYEPYVGALVVARAALAKARGVTS